MNPLGSSGVALASRIFIGAALLAATSSLSFSPARAMPVASGSKCNANWVNNQAAMSCFIQGEDEAHAGAAHPHYVACSAAGEVFCCVDDDKGNQNCTVAEATAGHPASTASWIHAILSAQQSHIQMISRKPAKPATNHAPEKDAPH
jgi:hypothetical protein